MFDIKLQLGGVCKLAVSPQRDQILTDLATASLTQAMAEYASGKLPRANIGDRFKPSALGQYSLLPRDAAYVKRQVRANGFASPYVSPRRANLAAVALKLAQAAKNPNSSAMIGVTKALAKALAPRMRDLVRKPGVGHRIISTRARGRVTLRLSWPGARVLNRQGGHHAETYRSQFADLTAGNRRDWLAIADRARTIYVQALQAATSRRAA